MCSNTFVFWKNIGDYALFFRFLLSIFFWCFPEEDLKLLEGLLISTRDTGFIPLNILGYLRSLWWDDDFQLPIWRISVNINVPCFRVFLGVIQSSWKGFSENGIDVLGSLISNFCFCRHMIDKGSKKWYPLLSIVISFVAIFPNYVIRIVLNRGNRSNFEFVS